MTPPNPTLSQRIAEQAAAAIAWVRGVSMFVKLVLVAGGAFVSAVAKFAPLPTTPIDVKDIVGITGAIAAFIGAGALLFLDRSLADSLKLAADATAELQKAQTAAATLGARFAETAARERRSGALSAAAGALRRGVEQALRRDPPDEAATMTELLDVGLNELQTAMDFVAADIWTISIYRADYEPVPVLSRVATRRSLRSEEAKPSREWKSGEGHIGMTFLRAEEVILEDVTDPAVRHALNTPRDKDVASDAWRYKSIAAVPVIPDGAQQPWGVVIATCSRAGQFSPVVQSEGSERAEAMRVLSGMIALAASTHHIVSTIAARPAGSA